MLPPIIGSLWERANWKEGVTVSRDIWVDCSHALCWVYRRVRFQRCDPRDFKGLNVADSSGTSRA
eukprot:6655300-Pyramimonas_sp.AAC.1